MLEQAEHEQRQELHIVRHHQLRAGPTSRARHRRLVRAQNVDKLVHDRVSRVFKLALHASLDGLVGQQCRKCHCVDATVHLGDAGRCRERGRDDANPALAKCSRVQNGRLEHNEWCRNRILNLNFDRVRLVHGHSRE